MSSSTSTDPSDFVRNPPSVIVKIQNTSQATVNGQLGVVVQYNADRGRYLVHLASTQQTIALKPENLIKGNMMDQMKAQYLLITKDPRVRQEIDKYYSLLETKLPSNVKPEHAAAGLLLFLFLSMYWFGFTRVLMMISLVLMIGLIIGPDIIGPGGRMSFDGRLIIANFPNRCRLVIEQTLPMARGKLSNSMAAGIIALLLFMSAKAVFMPPQRPSVSSNNSPVMEPPSTSTLQSTTRTGKIVSIEEAYKLGFDDSSLGKEFGTSLPDTTTSATARSSASMNYPEYSMMNDYNDDMMFVPPVVRSQPWYSKIGIWQVMGMMNIGRTVFEMGRDPVTGTFSAPLVIPNIQNANPMKLGLLGLSVYNILKVFMA